MPNDVSTGDDSLLVRTYGFRLALRKIVPSRGSDYNCGYIEAATVCLFFTRRICRQEVAGLRQRQRSVHIDDRKNAAANRNSWSRTGGRSNRNREPHEGLPWPPKRTIPM